MSFDAIPTAVLVHVLARFFVFEGTVDPARSRQQCTAGYRLLQLRKFSATETAQLKRSMDRIQVDHSPSERWEYGSADTCRFKSITDASGMHLSWCLVYRYSVPDYLVRVWNEPTRRFVARPHPILGLNAQNIQGPRRLSFGKTI